MLVKQIQVVGKVSSAFLRFEALSFRFSVDTRIETQDSKPKRNDRGGFTLVEVIVILAVIGILAAVAVPVALKIFERTAEEATREEMDNLRRAMIGDSRKLQSSFRSDFGFLGDIGCLPVSLDRLLTIGTLPAWSFDSTKQTGAGWKGPYITGAATGEETEEYTKDQLGNDYDYSASGACPLTATLTSNGPDGQLGTADDIILEVLAVDTTATIRGSLKDNSGNPLVGVSVDLNFPSGGTLSTATATTDSNGNYSFVNAPFGARSVEANAAGFVLVAGSVSADSDDISFDAANLRSTAAVIDQMSAVFSGGANYDQIQIDNDTVDQGSNFVSGEVVDLNAGDVTNGDTTFAAGTGKPPLRVVVDNVDTQLPDIVLIPGTTRTVELNNFSSDPRGIPITVSFIESGVVVGSVSFTP